MRSLAARAVAARKAKGLTQQQLADMLGVNQSLISRMERGETGISLDLLLGLRRVLGIPLATLLEEEAGEGTSAFERIKKAEATPSGLRALADDKALTKALVVEDDEWRALASIDLPTPVSKDGYVQLLITIRAITK